MTTVKLTWIEKQRYVGVDSAGHSVVLSSQNDIGVPPADLLLLSLATCVAYTVVEILTKQQTVRLARLTVTTEGSQAPDPPWAYEAIHLRFNIAATNTSADKLARIVDLSLRKYCAVHASLSSNIAITYEVQCYDPDTA